MGSKKIIVDLLFGAAIPLAILSWGSDLGLSPRMTFVLAGLIPAAYVLGDVFFYSKKFNFITTVIAVTAVAQGVTSFLQVSGWKYALADTSGTIITLLIFGISLLMGRPIVNYFVVQVFQPENPDEEALLQRMLGEREVHKWMVIATLVILAESFVRGVGNFLLNTYRVTAEFNTPEFITQKRNVDALTRFIAPAMSFGALFIAFYLVNNAIEKWIGTAGDEGGSFFNQIRKRLGIPTVADAPSAAPTAPAKSSDLTSAGAADVPPTSPSQPAASAGRLPPARKSPPTPASQAN